MKFSTIKIFFSKCDQIRWKLLIQSHLLKKSLQKTSFFVQCLKQFPLQFLNSEKFQLRKFLNVILECSRFVCKASEIPSEYYRWNCNYQQKIGLLPAKFHYEHPGPPNKYKLKFNYVVLVSLLLTLNRFYTFLEGRRVPMCSRN